MTSPSPVVAAENVSKVYRLYEKNIDRLFEAIHPFQKTYHTDFQALKDVSFSIAQGESVGIIGRNGSGKSTLLKVLTGVIVPSGGQVKIRGQVAALLELGAGFNPELTGLENIYFNGALMGFSRHEMSKRLQGIVEFADIGEFINQPVRLYSSGMFARLAFAVAINVDPDILIVDEALSVGDFAFQQKCFHRIRELKERKGLTLIFVSHDVNAVKSLCGRCLWMREGVLSADGPAGDLCDEYIQSQMAESGLFFEAVEGAKAQDPVDTPALTSEQFADFQQRASVMRRGDQRVQIAYAELLGQDGTPTGATKYNERLTLSVFVKANVDLPSAVLAFYIKDKNQIEIIGTNSDYEDHSLRTLRKGDVHRFSFSFVNRLPAGDYSVSALVSDKVDDSNYYDWVDGLVLFSNHVDPRRQRWCRWTPDFTTELTRIHGVAK